jgi:glycine oxidase
VKTWDAIIVGGGVIGLSLAWRLKAHHLGVLVVDKREPAREASYAAGGMIAHCDPHNPPGLRALASASATMYPEFVRELESGSGESVDLRGLGTIAYLEAGDVPGCGDAHTLCEAELFKMEPLLRLRGTTWFLPERSVDPRGLGRALVKAIKHRGVDIATGHPVIEVVVANGRTAGVRTIQSEYAAQVVVNCAGAWADQIQPLGIPTHPVKGQMVCLVPQPGAPHSGPLVQHVVRTPDVYIIPRSDGRILLGATVEHAGFDKQVNPDSVQKLFQAGIKAVPELAAMRIHDAWAGLRPGSPDKLPILGETTLPGYYAATGHYRDGILLAPITAHLMAQLITGNTPDLDLQHFSPLRFG